MIRKWPKSSWQATRSTAAAGATSRSSGANLGLAWQRTFWRELRTSARSANNRYDAEQGWQAIIAIVERTTERLKAKEHEHQQHADRPETLAAAARAFDATPYAAKLNRWEQECARAVARGLDTLRKHRRWVEQQQKASPGGKRGVRSGTRAGNRKRAGEKRATSPAATDQARLDQDRNPTRVAEVRLPIVGPASFFLARDGRLHARVPLRHLPGDRETS